MSAQTPVSSERSPRGAGWRGWLPILLLALVLLALSEALWLWQTWPVRQLLEVGTATARAPAKTRRRARVRADLPARFPHAQGVAAL